MSPLSLSHAHYTQTFYCEHPEQSSPTTGFLCKIFSREINKVQLGLKNLIREASFVLISPVANSEHLPSLSWNNFQTIRGKHQQKQKQKAGATPSSKTRRTADYRTDVSVGPLGAALCSLLGNTDVCKFISDTQIILGGTPDIHLAEILGSRGPAAALCLQNAGIMLKTVGE